MFVGGWGVAELFEVWRLGFELFCLNVPDLAVFRMILGGCRGWLSMMLHTRRENPLTRLRQLRLTTRIWKQGSKICHDQSPDQESQAHNGSCSKYFALTCT